MDEEEKKVKPYERGGRNGGDFKRMLLLFMMMMLILRMKIMKIMIKTNVLVMKIMLLLVIQLLLFLFYLLLLLVLVLMMSLRSYVLYAWKRFKCSPPLIASLMSAPGNKSYACCTALH